MSHPPPADLGAFNPYARRAEDVHEPPRRFRAMLPYFGPGLIVVASVVGSGELILTTALGAQVGFACLWVVALSCLSKTMMMAELGRFTISSGETCLDAFNKLPGPATTIRGRRIGWFLYLWVMSQVPNIIGGGGIIGGVGQVLQVAAPLATVSAPLVRENQLTGDMQWAVLMFAVTMVLIQSGRYRIVEAACTSMVLIFTASTIVCAVALQWTEYAVRWSDVAEGFRFQMPAGALLVALGAYGGTGTTPNECMAYTYWCIEKGYARYAGRPDGTETWRDRARGWLRVMHLDVLNVMILFTVATFAFYFLGAAVLKPMIAHGEIALRPGSRGIDGPTTIAALSNTYTQTLGPWAQWLFLIGSFAVLYSTVVSGWSAGGRVWSDMLGQLGLVDVSDYRKRLRWIRFFSLVLPTITTVSYLFYNNPVMLLAVAGTVGTLMTPVTALATLYLRRHRTDRQIAPTRWGDAALYGSVALMVTITPLALWQALRTTVLSGK